MASLWEVFSLKKRQTSFRVNLSNSHQELISCELNANNIWYSILDFPHNCFLLDKGFSESDLWSLDMYKKWYIYIQWIASQSPVHFFSEKKTSESLRILDACAAPGWKTSQLFALYPDAEIWAFEPHKIRYDKMCHNLHKLWCQSVKTIYDSIENVQKYISDTEYFDFVLIDAPCSWEWAISYHNEKFLQNWDISHIKKNYKRQKRICDSVLPYLKIWGEIIYSTCTLAPEENEAVAHYLLCNYPELELQNIDFSENKYIKLSSAMKTFEKQCFKKEISENCVRVIPSEFSEWFFISKFKKCSI